MASGPPPTYPAQAADYYHTINQLMYPSGNYGPHPYGSNLYLVAGEITASGTAPDHITVLKSTDRGLTWADSDAANDKATTTSTYLKTVPVGVHVSDDTLVIAINAAPLQLHQFSMSAGTWGTPISTSGGPTAEDMRDATWLTSYSRAFPAYRSDNSYIVLYQTTPMTDGYGGYYSRMAYSTFSSTWGAPTSLTAFGTADYWEECAAGACIHPPSDRFHAFYLTQEQSSPYKARLRHRSVSYDGTLSSETTVDAVDLESTGFSGSVIPSCIVSQSLCIDDTIYIAYVRYDGTKSEICVASSASGPTMTWGTSTISYLTSTSSDMSYYPDTSVIGNILSLSSGLTSHGIYYSANPNQGTTGGGDRLLYYPFSIISDLYLYVRLAKEGSDTLGSSFIFTRLPFGGSWTTPVEITSAYQLTSVIGNQLFNEATTPVVSTGLRAVIY